VFEDAFNKNNLTVSDELFTPRVVYHNAALGLASGIEGYRQVSRLGWRQSAKMIPVSSRASNYFVSDYFSLNQTNNNKK